MRIATLILTIIIIVIEFVAFWKIFTKTGRPGWTVFIPMYNIISYLQIIGKPWWWMFLIIFLPFIFGIWSLNLLSKSFSSDLDFTLGLIFLNPIYIFILAFGKSEYTGPAGTEIT